MMSHDSKSNAAQSLYEIECQREEEILELSKERFERNTSHLNEHNRGGDNHISRVVINRLCAPLADAIEEFLDPAEKTRGWNAGNKALVRTILKDSTLDSTELAFCTLKAVLNEFFRPDSGNMLTRHAYTIVEAIAISSEYAQFKEANPKAAHKVTQRVIKKKGGINNRYGRQVIATALEEEQSSIKEFPTGNKLAIGVKMVELLIESTGAFQLKKEYRGKHDSPILLVASEELLALVSTCADQFSVLMPQYRMMVVPPAKWHSMFSGGYVLPLKSLHPSAIKQRGTAMRMLKEYNLSTVFSALNAIQETPWQINWKVLETAQAVWDMGGGLAGIPEVDDREVPVKPFAPDLSRDEFNLWKEEHKEEYRKWADAAQEVYKFNKQVGTNRLRVSYQLRIAAENRNFERLYFPHTCDFRGRVYPLPPYVNPQSDDLGKALLRFAEGKPLGAQGAYWLMIHLANCAGEDKVSFEDRIDWVKNHEQEIVACAENPVDNMAWADMDSPFQFLAAAIEYAGYLKEGEGFISHIPVAMDGTCNGLQHLSAMLRDSKGGEAVNLVPAMRPHDIYTEVLEELKKLLETEASSAENPTDRFMAASWMEHMIRAVAKRPVMTTPYGVSSYGVRDQILDQITDNNWFHGSVIKYTDWALWLTKRMQAAITSTITAAPLAMGWMQEASRAIAKVDEEQVGVTWVVPGTGFPVIQRYLETLGEKVRLFIGEQTIQLHTGEQDENTVDTRRQTAGISPNVIHSLDAGMLMLTVLKLKEQGIHSYALIHDSYGTHACDSPVLHQILREQFVNLYTEHDVLGELKSAWESKYDIELSDIPEKGSLDIHMVNYSRYFFA